LGRTCDHRVSAPRSLCPGSCAGIAVFKAGYYSGTDWGIPEVFSGANYVVRKRLAERYCLLFFLFLSGARTHQEIQFPVQTLTILFGQINKAKRLQASLSRPHRKHHSRFAPDCCTAEVKQNRHADRFVQWVFERQQSSINRKLIHAAANLAAVLEQHQHKNGAPKLDSQAPVFLRHGAGRWHSASILHY
jgi:hypothetical protein